MKPIALILFLAASTSLHAAVEPRAAVDPRVPAFLKTYCIDCHGPKKQKGDFRVDELKVSATAADAENWQKTQKRYYFNGTNRKNW